MRVVRERATAAGWDAIGAGGLKVAFQPRISTFTDARKGIKRDFQSPGRSAKVARQVP